MKIPRDYAIREIGCVCCRQAGIPGEPCEKHHLNGGDQPGRKRRGEAYTVGLCQWHHVGRCWCSGSPVETDCPDCTERRGPSWRHHKRDFLMVYGDGDQLLAYQNDLIKLWGMGVIE